MNSKITKNSWLLFLVCLPNFGFSQTPTRLQFLVTKDRVKAEIIISKLNELGAGPAEIKTTPEGLHKVVSKVYPSLAEANLAKPFIVGNGFTDAFAVAELTDKKQADSLQVLEVPSITSMGSFNETMFDVVVAKTQYPSFTRSAELDALKIESASERALLQKAFSYSGDPKLAPEAISALTEFSKRFPDSPQAVAARMKTGYWQVAAGDNTGAKATFEAVLKDAPSHVRAGEAMLRLGYLAIREKNYGDALTHFHGVASGKVASAEDVRAEAVLRTAALFHRGKDLESSKACYKVVLETFKDPTVRAFAQVHLAGLTLELAWNKKATFEEARAECDKTLSQYPEAPRSIRATAALMALETLSYEGKYDEVLVRQEAALREATDTAEAPLVNYWIAKAYMETGNFEKAAQHSEAIISKSTDTTQRFKDLDLTSQAQRLATSAKEKAARLKQ